MKMLGKHGPSVTAVIGAQICRADLAGRAHRCPMGANRIEVIGPMLVFQLITAIFCQDALLV